VWLLVVDGLDGLVEIGECFCSFKLALEDVLPALFPGFEVFDKLWHVSIVLAGRINVNRTLSIMSSAALKSANTTPTSAWSSDLLPKAPKRLCMDFIMTSGDCM
jgi:hypothetical protein